MSYVRFGWGPNNEYPGSREAKRAGPSDLYIFGTWRDFGQGRVQGIECCGCLLSTKKGEPRFPFFTTLDEVIAHLNAHRNAGHVVHDFVQSDIEADFEDNSYAPDWVKA